MLFLRKQSFIHKYIHLQCTDKGSNATYHNTSLTACLLRTTRAPKILLALSALRFIFSYYGEGELSLGEGVVPKRNSASNAPAEQLCKKPHVARNPPVGAACPPHHPFPTAQRKAKGPQILRRWGHLEHTRRNWGDEAEMMRRLKRLPSINKCNTLQSLKEWALC